MYGPHPAAAFSPPQTTDIGDFKGFLKDAKMSQHVFSSCNCSKKKNVTCFRLRAEKRSPVPKKLVVMNIKAFFGLQTLIPYTLDTQLFANRKSLTCEKSQQKLHAAFLAITL